MAPLFAAARRRRRGERLVRATGPAAELVREMATALGCEAERAKLEVCIILQRTFADSNAFRRLNHKKRGGQIKT